MITVIAADGNSYPLTAYEEWHIKHKEDGCDTMSFCVDPASKDYQYIAEEESVITDGNKWLIKKIDDDKITCALDFDFLKENLYVKYESKTRLLYAVLAAHLPEDWTIEGSARSTIRRTIRFDFCTDYDVIYKCMDTYNVYFRWHLLEKRLEVLYNDDEPSGKYLTSELNLKELSFKGDTSDFATRLYAFGKEGMTMANAVVNGEPYGKTYVDNNSWSSKVVCAYWSDERYTVPENLYDAAVARLATLAYPVRSYECQIRDLSKQSTRYAFLELSMHSVVTLIDVERSISVNHRIVEYDEWPDEPDNNAVTMSSVPMTIRTLTERLYSQQADSIAEVNSLAEQAARSAVDEALGEYDDNFDQIELFNRLTNGNQMGLYLTGGVIYLDPSYFLWEPLTDGTMALVFHGPIGQRIVMASNIRLTGDVLLNRGDSSWSGTTKAHKLEIYSDDDSLRATLEAAAVQQEVNGEQTTVYVGKLTLYKADGTGVELTADTLASILTRLTALETAVGGSGGNQPT